MVLKLDERFATVWRDPFSLQLGVDPARVVLRDVGMAEERMLSALERGVSRSGLEMIAASSDGDRRDVGALLRTLKPVLVLDATPRESPRISLVGVGPTVDRIAGILTSSGASVSIHTRTLGTNTREPSGVANEVDLGIVVGHYVLDPESYGFWLRRDVPHLPVVFGDDTVLVGPLIEPGKGPCLYCLEYHRRDADPSWSAIASQLWGRGSFSETALVSAETAARVARMALARTAEGSRPRRTMASRSFRIAVETGEVTRRDWMPHPECGCVALPGPRLAPVSAGPRESGSAADSGRPTTAGVAAARA